MNIILRICNFLLRRLSKHFDKEFRFKIHKKLTYWIPEISDRSAVNLLGNFAEKCDRSEESFNPTFNQIRHLYEACKDPVTYFKDKLHINAFLEKLEKLLDTLSKNNEYTWNIGIKRPKEHLLDFHLGDSAFVSNLLCKVLVLAHTLNSPVNPVQQDAFAFSETQKNLMNACLAKAESLLNAVDCGKAKCMQHVLIREDAWVLWKSNNCPKFEKAPCEEELPGDHIEIEEGEVEEQRFFFEDLFGPTK